MGRIPDDTIEAVRDRVDIVETVGRYVGLRQTGRSFKGLCPFHDEKTPSFHVNPERGIFHCFGCGAGGDAFQFLIRHENLSFPEAIRILARDVGVTIPESEEGQGISETLRKANDCAQMLYRKAWVSPEGEGARAYWSSRGLNPETADRFGVGFAPDSWDRLQRSLATARIEAEVGERAGLLARRRRGEGHYDLLRGRLTFPIHDVRGRILGFGGRALSDGQEPKYLNTPETPIFRKREAFYGLPDALAPIRRAGRAIVVEGYFDRIALAVAGLEEALATCGTALTDDHARQLRRRTREVVLLFDGDEAGHRAVVRSLEILLPEGLRVRVGVLPSGQDPAGVLEEEGAEELRQIVNSAPPALEVVIRRAAASGRQTPWEKADAAEGVVELLARIPDPVERGEFARQTAFALEARAEDVEAALRSRLANLTRDRHSGGRDEASAIPVRPRRSGPDERATRYLARLLFEYPELWKDVDLEQLAQWLPGSPWQELLSALFRASADLAGDPARASLPPETLDPQARVEWLALAVETGPVAPVEEASRAVNDTLAWLRKRHEARRRRETTERLREDPSVDPAEILAEKQRQLEERRLALGLPAGSARVLHRA